MVSASVLSYNGDARNATVDGVILAPDPSLRVIRPVDRATFLAATKAAGYNNGAGATLTQSTVSVHLVEPGSKLLGCHNQFDGASGGRSPSADCSSRASSTSTTPSTAA